MKQHKLYSHIGKSDGKRKTTQITYSWNFPVLCLAIGLGIIVSMYGFMGEYNAYVDSLKKQCGEGKHCDVRVETSFTSRPRRRIGEFRRTRRERLKPGPRLKLEKPQITKFSTKVLEKWLELLTFHLYQIEYLVLVQIDRQADFYF